MEVSPTTPMPKEDSKEMPAKHSFESLLEEQDFSTAEREADKALSELSVMASAALTRGKAIIYAGVKQMMEDETPLPRERLVEAWGALKLSARLNPGCKETKAELNSLMGLMEELKDEYKTDPLTPDKASSDSKAPDSTRPDVIVVGAGAVGVGCAVMMTETFGLDASRVLLIERGDDIGKGCGVSKARNSFICINILYLSRRKFPSMAAGDALYLPFVQSAGLDQVHRS